MTYTFEQLQKKFGFEVSKISTNRQINSMKVRGVEIKKVKEGNKWHPTEYEIVKDIISDKTWYKYEKANIEFCIEGIVRDIESKRILNLQQQPDGYVVLKRANKQYSFHRILMETLFPIEDMENHVVDHINGIRNDNRIENLRWASQEHNLYLRDKNRKDFQKITNLIINKYGYEKALEIFKKELTKYL